MRIFPLLKTSFARTMSSEALVNIPTVTQLSKRVIRILGGNPSSFTLQGTNTYLIDHHPNNEGDGIPCVLIDVAEGKDEHLNALKEVLQGSHKDLQGGRRRVVTDMYVHPHHTMFEYEPTLTDFLF